LNAAAAAAAVLSIAAIAAEAADGEDRNANVRRPAIIARSTSATPSVRCARAACFVGGWYSRQSAEDDTETAGCQLRRHSNERRWQL